MTSRMNQRSRNGEQELNCQKRKDHRYCPLWKLSADLLTTMTGGQPCRCYVYLLVHLLHAPPPQHHRNHYRHHKHVGPSRLHRRARRDAARAYAAEQAAATVRVASQDVQKEDSIEIDDNVSPPKPEQADSNQSDIEHKTVQAVAKPNLNDDNTLRKAKCFSQTLAPCCR